MTTEATQISLVALGFPGCPCAQVVKLVDTLASGASARKGVEVQVLFWAPSIKHSCNLSFVEPSAAVETLQKFDSANELSVFSLGLRR